MKIMIIQGGLKKNSLSGEKVVVDNDISYLNKKHDVFYKNIIMPSSGIKLALSQMGGIIWSMSNYIKIGKLLKKKSPDIVHFHTVTPYLSFSSIAAVKNAGIPIVQTLHNGRWLCLEGGFFRNNTFCDDCVGSYGFLGVVRGCGRGRLSSFLLFLSNFYIRRFLLFGSVFKFIAVSEFVRDQHIRSGFPKDSIIIRNNGFNISSELKIDDLWLHRKGLVYAGRLSVAKGSRVLEHLIKNLNCKISIIGNGPELNSLKQFCIDHQFDHVEFFGKLDNKAVLNVIKKAVVTVVPSQCGDSYPTVALESLSVGTPVVASNLGGLPDIIDASIGGELVDHESHNVFLQSVKDLLNDRERAKQMGDNGMKYVKENVNTNKQGKELIKIYNKVIKDYKLGNDCSI